MTVSRVSENYWIMKLGERVLSFHRPEEPFVTAVLKEKKYHADRGTVKTEVKESRRVPLTRIRHAGENGLALEGEDHVLEASFSGDENTVTLTFRGQAGWAYEFRLPADGEKAVFGGGEQYRQVDLKGETVVHFVSEHIKASTVIQKALLPKKLYREKPHSEIGSYAPMPVYVTDSGLGIVFETDADGTASFESDPFVFSFDACPASLTLMQGTSYADLARRMTERFPNRQYLPGWCHDGMILGVQGGTERVLEKCFALLDAGAKISAVWCQDWSGENRTAMGKQVWWNWEADEKLYPDLKQAVARLKERGVRFLAYINPYLVKGSRLYEYCREKGFLILRQDGEVCHIRSTTFDAGMLDLTDPEAVRFIKEVLIGKNMLSLGISGWMADFGEYLPVDCVLKNGDPALLHNEWPVLWAKLNREAIEEFGTGEEMFFSRSGYLGIQSWAPILWNGDQHTDLTRDYGMPCIMPASFSLGFSGVTLMHADIGGFFSFGKMKRKPELFIRWMEMGAFSVLMRSHESLRPWANAQPYDEAVRPYTVKLSRVHAALKPYLEQLVREAREGLPAMRPDFWEAGSYAAGKDPYSYFLGRDLYVCPVIQEKAGTRRVHLPEGAWTGFWDGRDYAGGSSFEAEAPLGRIPVFYRKESAFAALFREAAEIKA